MSHMKRGKTPDAVLMHWKYAYKKKVNGKWRYYYKDASGNIKRNVVDGVKKIGKIAKGLQDYANEEIIPEYLEREEKYKKAQQQAIKERAEYENFKNAVDGLRTKTEFNSDLEKYIYNDQYKMHRQHENRRHRAEAAEKRAEEHKANFDKIRRIAKRSKK